MAILQLSFVPRWMSLTNCNFLSVCLIHVTGFCFGANLNFKGYPQAKMQVDLGRCKCLLWFLQYLRKKSALLQIWDGAQSCWFTLYTCATYSRLAHDIIDADWHAQNGHAYCCAFATLKYHFWKIAMNFKKKKCPCQWDPWCFLSLFGQSFVQSESALFYLCMVQNTVCKTFSFSRWKPSGRRWWRSSAVRWRPTTWRRLSTNCKLCLLIFLCKWY